MAVAKPEFITADLDVPRFERDGFLVARGFATAARCARLRAAALQALQPLRGPAEFEADVGYPGAPSDRGAVGGATPRRLLHAFSRGSVYRDWAVDRRLAATLQTLFGDADVRLSQCHHNCVMTKHPGFSSKTSWHRDQRYWSFERPELISVWLALGAETRENGALQVIPGSHRLDLAPEAFDAAQFLRTDLKANSALIESAESVELDSGDVLFFSSRLLHAAGRNETDSVKLSLVFTYHRADNAPEPGTRSARFPSIEVRA